MRAARLSLIPATAAIAVSAIAGKLAFRRGGSPEQLVVARFAISALVAALALPWLLRRFHQRPDWRDLAAAVGVGVLLYAGSRAEFVGLHLLPAGILVLILVTGPVWIAAAGWLIWREPLTWGRALKIAAVVGGVAMMVDPRSTALSRSGIALAAGAALAGAVFFIAIERVKMPPLVTVAIAMLTAGVAALLLDPSGLEAQLPGSPLAPMTLAIAGTGCVWALLLAIGMTSADALTTATVLALEPVMVAVAALIVLGEHLSLREICGGLVVIGGAVATVASGGEGTSEQTKDNVGVAPSAD